MPQYFVIHANYMTVWHVIKYGVGLEVESWSGVLGLWSGVQNCSYLQSSTFMPDKFKQHAVYAPV